MKGAAGEGEPFICLPFLSSSSALLIHRGPLHLRIGNDLDTDNVVTLSAGLRR
jgi:hypothetical protein